MRHRSASSLTAVPVVVQTARNVSFLLLKAVKQELERMEKAGIIRSMFEPVVVGSCVLCVVLYV